jgi:hypothetical protein
MISLRKSGRGQKSCDIVSDWSTKTAKDSTHGVEDSEEVSLRSRESPPQVSGLLQSRTVLTADVVVAVLRSHGVDGLRRSIIQDIHLEFSFRILQLLDVLVSILEDFDGLFAAGKIHIDCGTRQWVDRILRQDLPVFLDVVVLATDADRIADDEVGLKHGNDYSEPVEVYLEEWC